MSATSFIDSVLTKATPLEPITLTQREQDQLKAKEDLTKVLNYFERDSSIIDDLHPHQYIFALNLLDSAGATNTKKIDILEAKMNGGKTYIIARLLITMLKITEKDAIFFTSYYSQVVEQFLQDITSTKCSKNTKGFIQQMTEELGDRDLHIVANSSSDEKAFDEMVSRVSIFSKGQITLHTLDGFNKIRKNRHIKQSIDDGYIIAISTIQSSNDAISTKKQPLLKEALFGRKTFGIGDEFHTGTPLKLDNKGSLTYGDVTGFKGESYKAVYFDTLNALNITKMIGVTGTPTIAHELDDWNFTIKPDLINKEEVIPFSKKVKAHFTGFGNDLELALERLESCLNHTIDTVNKKLKTENKKSIAVVVIPADSGLNTSKQWLAEIEDYIFDNFNLGKNAVAVFHGTESRDDCISLNSLKKRCNDINDPLQVIIVKQKLAAGVNIPNISSIAMIKKSINPAEIFNGIVQLWGRGIRYSDYIDTLHMFLPIEHKQAYKFFIEHFAEESK